MKPKVIFMPHANIQYSQLAPEKRAWVMKNCYEKLFDIIDNGDYKIAFEASGITIDEMADKAPEVLESLKSLSAKEKSSPYPPPTFTLCFQISRKRFAFILSNTLLTFGKSMLANARKSAGIPSAAGQAISRTYTRNADLKPL